MKYLFVGIFSALEVAFIAYLLLVFLESQNFILILSGICFQILMVFFFSKYSFGKFINGIIIIVGIVACFKFEFPVNTLARFAAINYILLTIIKYNLNNIVYAEIGKLDNLFNYELLNSPWYQDNKNKYKSEINIDSLVIQEFFQKSIVPIAQLLIKNKHREFSRSKFNMANLSRIHAIGIIYSLPTPFIKNNYRIISLGTQLLLNVYENLKDLNSLPNLNVENDELNNNSTKLLLEKSILRFGDITQIEMDEIKAGKYT